MYGAPSPYGQDNRKPAVQPYSPQPYQATVPPITGQIVPGSITYTTSIGPDGRTLYHPFKAVSASYQTANGIVSGIQWIPAEATHVVPAGAQPASSEFAQSWNRGYLNKDEKRLKEWQKEEDKRRKKEEKESSRRLRGHQDRDAELDLQTARELDAMIRERRKSTSGGVAPFPQGATPSAYSAAGGYSPNPTYVDPVTGGPQYGPTSSSVYGRERKYSNASGYADINRQMNDLDLGSDDDDDRGRQRMHRASRSQSRGRRYSVSQGAGDHPSPYVPATYASSGSPYNSPYTSSTATTGGYSSSGKYTASPNLRPGEAPFVPSGANAGPYSSSAYSSSGRKVNDPRSVAMYGSSGAPVYPPGHVMEGHPIPQPPRSRAGSRAPSRAPSRAASRAPSPLPMGNPTYASSSTAGFTGFPQASPRASPRPPPSPRLGRLSPRMPEAVLMPGGQQQLTQPEGFTRPVNPAAPFPRFETTKIQDMDDFLVEPSPPRMPQVLKSHDVYSEDWLRLMNDLKLAWNGQLPVPVSPTGQPPRRTTVVADMLDLWNTSFFLNRGVEVVLYKGKERRSGPKAGIIDHGLPDDDSDSELSETEEEDESELEEYLARSQNLYGRSPEFDPALLARRRREAREEKRRALKEKRALKKAREMEKRYALYITYVPVKGGQQHGVGGMQIPGAMPGAMPGMMPGMMPGGYPPGAGFVPPGVSYTGSSHRERY